jgi:hypothetical protein
VAFAAAVLRFSEWAIQREHPTSTPAQEPPACAAKIVRSMDERDVLGRLLDRETHDRVLRLKREAEHEGGKPTAAMIADDAM